MIAASFDGPVEQINYHSQHGTTNSSGTWYRMEMEWAAVAKGKRFRRGGVVIIPAGAPRTVRVDIRPQFNDNARPRRPNEFRVTYWYGGSTTPASTQLNGNLYKTVDNP